MILRKIFLLFVFLLGVIYLSIPTPTLPELRDSGRSDEPGDTTQHPDQKGFYSNLTRQEVLSDIQSQSNLKLLGYTIPSYRLNYPPEEAGTLVRDQLRSNYLEEIVYPLRNSIFVNGWEPKNAPRNGSQSAAKFSELFLHGTPYNDKITLRPVSSPLWARILVWTLIFPASYLVFLSFKKSLLSFK